MLGEMVLVDEAMFANMPSEKSLRILLMNECLDKTC